jgi:hypothetical protein
MHGFTLIIMGENKKEAFFDIGIREYVHEQQYWNQANKARFCQHNNMIIQSIDIQIKIFITATCDPHHHAIVISKWLQLLKLSNMDPY